MSSLISIIMPAFNRQQFVCKAIESALSQTWRNIELIIIDDGSTDDTKIVIEKYKKDSRFVYYYQKNQGQSVARNKGIKESHGEYIAFLDSDDIWLPDKLEKQIAIIEINPGYDVYYGDIVQIDIDDNVISDKNMKRYSGRISKYLIRDNFISMCTTLTRRDCFFNLGLFDERERIAEDYELWLRFSTKFKFFYSPIHYCKYRVMPDQLSSDCEWRLDANEVIIKKFLENNHGLLTIKDKFIGLSHFYTRKARHEVTIKKYFKALKSIVLALRYNPFWEGPWRVIMRLMLTTMKIHRI